MLADLHKSIRSTLNRQRSLLVRGSDITLAINSASRSLYRELIKHFRNTGNTSPLLLPFKGKATISDGSYTISSGAEYEVVSIVSASDQEALFTRSDINFSKDDQQAIIAQYPEFHHKDVSYTLTAADSGIKDLPDDYVSDLGVFTHIINGNKYEGHILDQDEFLDRKNSKILGPTEQHPIARVYDNTIEFVPVPTSPSTYNYVLHYKAFPVAKKPVVRAIKDGVDLDFEFRPTITEDFTVYYLKPPLVAAATYSVDAYGEETLTVSQDLDWNDDAYEDILTRSLIYLGIQTNNQGAAQLESLKDQNDVADAND